MEKTMSEITLFGFPRSVYVQMAGLVLTHKEVPYKFHDLEQEMGGPTHLALHPFDMLPIIHAFGFAPEAQATYPKFPSICTWRERMEALPTLKRFRAAQPPRGPIEHARKWVASHRPKY